MKLIRKLKIWKELKRLETRVRENPVPSTFVDLGQVYINLGMNDRTLQLAEEGLALFPKSEELRKLRRFAKKTQLNARIKDLRTRIDRGAQPRLYRELASLYLEQGDYDLVKSVSDECTRHFPNDEGALLVLAKARLTSFYRDLIAEDGIEAVRCLQRVVGLDPEHAKGHKMLAELLYRVGAGPEAIQHLDVLRTIAPEDQDVIRMLEELGRSSPFQEDLETLFQRVEGAGSLATAPVRADLGRSRGGGGGSGTPFSVAPGAISTGGSGSAGRGSGSAGGGAASAAADASALNQVRDALAQVADFAGVRKAAYIRGSKALVKGDIRDGKDPFLRVVRIVSKASQRSARRMDIGNFNKGVLEGKFGQICLCSYGEVVAGILCDAGTDVDRVLVELQELVAGSLYITGN